MFRRIITAIFLLVSTAALADVPIALPPGQALGDWEEALELAGMTLGPVDGRGVTVTAAGAEWRIDVVDGRGQTRSTLVAAPVDRGGREELVFLAKSLLAAIDAEPVEAPVRTEVRNLEPPEAVLVEPVRISRPAPTPVPEPYVVPPAQPAVSPPRPLRVEPQPRLPRPVVSPPPVREAAKPAPLWMDFEVVFGVRMDASPALIFGTHVGLAAGRWDMGVGIRGGAGHGLPKLERDRSMGDVSLQGVVSRRAGVLRVRGTGGVALRRFREQNTRVAEAWIPQAGLDAGWSGLGVVRIEPFVGLTADLRPVSLRIDGEPVQQVFPVSVNAGVRMALRGRPQ